MEENKRKFKEDIVLAIIIFSLALLVGSCFYSPTSSKSNSDNSSYCRSQSNTYYKCSYSVWEGRCVCKER